MGSGRKDFLEMTKVFGDLRWCGGVRVRLVRLCGRGRERIHAALWSVCEISKAHCLERIMCDPLKLYDCQAAHTHPVALLPDCSRIGAARRHKRPSSNGPRQNPPSANRFLRPVTSSSMPQSARLEHDAGPSRPAARLTHQQAFCGPGSGSMVCAHVRDGSKLHEALCALSIRCRVSSAVLEMKTRKGGRKKEI